MWETYHALTMRLGVDLNRRKEISGGVGGVPYLRRRFK